MSSADPGAAAGQRQRGIGRILVRARAAATGLGARRAYRRARRPHRHGGARRGRSPWRSAPGHRGARVGQSAQPRLPARHGRPDRDRRAQRRQLLELARADVPLPAATEPGRSAGHRRAGLRGDARGRLHPGRRVPLCASRRRRPPLRRPRRDGAASGCRGADQRYRHDPAAGVLCACRFRRRRAEPGATAPAARRRRLRRAAGRQPPRPAGTGRRGAGPGPAQPARGHPGRTGRAAAAVRRPGAHPYRRADPRGRCLPGLERAAAGAMAAGARAGGCALVPGACHPCRRGRSAGHRRQRRGGRAVPDHRGQSRRRPVPDA
ncbi:hypothetical protein NB706_003615 [Xanthomonas sacchari]|nr:hypothetical protein [Xanthomonas sacchari]